MFDHPALAGGLLTIAPSLEVVGLLPPRSIAEYFRPLRPLLTGADGGDHRVRDLSLVHDNESFSHDAVSVSDSSLSDLLDTYLHAASRPLRHRATHLEVSTFRCKGAVSAGLPLPRQSMAVSLANNFSPDDSTALAIRIDLANEEPWCRLIELRTNLMKMLGNTFWWSTLGYRFRLDHERLSAAGQEQSALGMRLLGVDWDDCFGGFTALSAEGLRSINWQTVVSDAALARWKAALGTFPASPAALHGHRQWQTGERPSTVDRNRGLSAEMREYVHLGHGLQVLCQNVDSEWFGEQVFERWSRRWSEVLK